MTELNNKLHSKLRDNGFKIVGRYISKRSNTDNKFKVVGQINENNLFFHSENVFPFKGGVNFFEDNDTKQDFKTYYTKVKENDRNDFNVSFTDYIKTTKQASTFNTFLNNSTKENLSKTAINYFDLRGVSNGYMEDATCFPFFDIDNNFVTAQIIKYASNGKRIKNKFSTNWYHAYKPIKSDLGLKDTDVYSVPVPCFFGENYLKDSDNIVAIVEAPKTASILKEIYPNIDWIATAGEQNLFNKNLDILRDKKVVLFPDAHTAKWKEFANEKGFYCSDILERTDVGSGSDIADFIFDYSKDKEGENNVFSELHELLFCLNKGEFNFEINTDVIKLDFKVDGYKTNYFTAVPQYYKGYKVLNQLDNSNDFDIVFKGKKFNIYSDKYELYTAQLDWHRPILKEDGFAEMTDIDFILKLQGVFRILKELNPKIYKGLFSAVVTRLRDSKFSFNERYVLERLVPFWDGWNRNLDVFKTQRNWKYKGSDSLTREEFIQELNNHRFQYKLKIRLEYLNDILVENRFIDLETDLNISKFTKGLSKIRTFVKQWNENVIGCKTLKTYFNKIEFNSKINECTKKLPLHNKGLIYGGNYFVQSNISVTDAIKATGIKNRKTVKNFLTFQADTILKEEIFNDVFYLLNNVSDVVPTRQIIGNKTRIVSFEIVERKPPNIDVIPLSPADAFIGLDSLKNIDTSNFTENELGIYLYESNYLQMLDNINHMNSFDRKDLLNSNIRRTDFISTYYSASIPSKEVVRKLHIA
jgi:hypothetical protein